MQEVIRKCDYTEGKGPCGNLVPEGSPTTFVVNAVTYEMDLCPEHYSQFVSALEPFLTAAEPTKMRNKSTVRTALKGKKGSTFTTKDVRNWLREQGKEVSPSGRIPNALIEEYKAAVGA